MRDMVQLQHKHPEVLQEFRRGKFVVQKVIKSSRLRKSALGVANLFDMPQAMDEHGMALCEKMQALNDFEVTDIFTSFHNMVHHEEGSNYEDKFAKDVLSVLEILRLKKPFSLQT